jgi:hypothetical protein
MQSFDKEVDLCVTGTTSVFKTSGCQEQCIKGQLENGHKGMGKLSTDVKHSPSGTVMTNAEISLQATQLKPTTVAP